MKQYWEVFSFERRLFKPQQKLRYCEQLVTMVRVLIQPAMVACKRCTWKSRIQKENCLTHVLPIGVTSKWLHMPSTVQSPVWINKPWSLGYFSKPCACLALTFWTVKAFIIRDPPPPFFLFCRSPLPLSPPTRLLQKRELYITTVQGSLQEFKGRKLACSLLVAQLSASAPNPASCKVWGCEAEVQEGFALSSWAARRCLTT